MSIGIRPVFEQRALEQGFDIGRADDNSYRTETTDAAWGGWVAANAPTPNTRPELERVIEEQQREIDMQKKRNDAYLKSWSAQTKRYEDMSRAALGVLDSTSPECHLHLRQLLIQHGWCITCNESPCECYVQYD